MSHHWNAARNRRKSEKRPPAKPNRQKVGHLILTSHNVTCLKRQDPAKRVSSDTSTTRPLEDVNASFMAGVTGTKTTSRAIKNASATVIVSLL
ncbi:hypothetical protein OS493_006333 [Desmophyllum pertusum]|uniref:Uncharacterized protein n=1 Tax=Desmophyllum pertusum TaxID=174260 RepID=A0A9X0A4Q0_9CNID|nr:hypothetical protein OS493_006333 [Desmophyllum pertusum]